MTGTDAKLANATAIETYGHVMKSKGLHARAEWAYALAQEIRRKVALSLEAPIAVAA